MGIHPADIVIGYNKGVQELEKFLLNFKSLEVKDVRNIQEVSRFMQATIMSKQYGLEDKICNLVADACIRVCPKNPANFNVD